MKNTGIAIVSLVGGLIIGSALTMLFTPQSGPELRRKIKEEKRNGRNMSGSDFCCWLPFS